ncbi:MAG: hypothetical protein B5M51_08870 [Anaerolinea sp. 4484_236]|nr:MAG: hypothetical protein B5M51_08870 [Anaerolinea sp. 4484_236]RLD06564.1 MAG: hypothetical protein DRI56_07835 [Chloroflexota bacterium]
MPFMLGENVGPYRLIEQLGQGGMATVFKAYHARLDRYVAIKALHPAFMTDPNFEARFQREARVVARLEHPNIVPIYDFAEHEGRPYLVLKYVEGETLKARLTHSNLLDKDIENVFNAVSSALAYAHQEGVLHRDVKPSNVLMANDGRIYLADFGLARIAQAGESTLSTDMMLGTPQYISPEQAKGTSSLDEGTDIYSLGVMLYELLVGKVPFSADTPFSVIHDHIYSPLPLPREVNPAISESLERALLKSLAKDREDRYQDVPEMAKAFQVIFDNPEEKISIPSKHAERTKPGDVETVPPVLGVREEHLPQPAVEPTPQPSPVVKEDAPTQARKRSIPKWVWWMGLPALCILCLVGLVIARAVQNPGPSQMEDTVFEVRSIHEIEDDLNAEQDNPYLLLELAIAHLEDGQFQNAEDEILDILDLAQDEPYLYCEMGDMLAAHGVWIYAAPFYVLAEQNIPNPPEGIGDQVHQAVYLAAFNPKAVEILQDPRLNIEPLMLELVKARDALMRGDFNQAEDLYYSVLEQQPDMPEALLFEVDLRRESGDMELAREILQELKGRDYLPEWVSEEVAQALDEFSWDVGEKNDEDDGLDDPYECVDLSIKYWKENQRQNATEAAFRAFKLADGDADLYWELGDMFAQQNIWLYAAPAYLLADKYNGGAEEDILYGVVGEAVYFAAFEDEAIGILTRPELELNHLLRELIEARHEMVMDNLDEAEEKLNSILDRKPDMLMAKLLKAELLGERGEIEAARGILLELQRKENLPEWMRIQTQELWKKLDEQQ